MTNDSNKRKRATREEMIRRTEEKLAKLKAQAEGSFTPDAETLVVKRLRNALRRRKTALHRATVMLNGRAATEKSPSMNGIDEKIENARKRLADLEASKSRAEERVANLPFDISKIETILENAEKSGEEPTFPDDLFPLDNESTESEVEVAAGEPDDESEGK